jgi:ABC-2 type transport system permease protein
MNKSWLVFHHEFRALVFQRRFLLALLSVPVVILVIVAVAALLGQGGDETRVPLGYVDQAGILTPTLLESQTDANQYDWTGYPSQEQARDALSGGAIDAYFVVTADYLATRQVELIHAGDVDESWVAVFSDALRIAVVDRLVDQPPQVVSRVIQPPDVVVQLPNGRQFSSSLNLGDFVPMLSGFVLTILVLVGSGYLAEAVVEEKTNRTMEIVATSVSPEQLMTGKVLASVGATLTLALAWLVIGGLALFAVNSILAPAWLQDVQLHAGPLALTAALLLLTFLTIAGVMTALGASLEARAGQTVATAAVPIFMLGLGFLIPLLGNLNGGAAVAFSLLPVMTALVMPVRATFAQVPLWQVVAALLIQASCAGAGIWLAARSVRLGMLRYGRSLSLRDLLGRPQEAGRVEAISTVSRVDRRPTRGRERVRNKTWIILIHELKSVMAQPYFWLVVIGIPLLVFGQMWLFQRAMPEQDRVALSPGEIDIGTAPTAPAPSEVVGYVDQSGLIQEIPAGIPAGALVRFTSQADAQRAMDQGRIASYAIIPSDYLARAEIILIRREYNPIGALPSPGWLRWTLLVNLLGGNSELASRVWDPLVLEVRSSLSTPSAEAQARIDEEIEDQARITSMLIMLLFYAVIVMAAGLVMRSVTEEKKNRAIEILLSSASSDAILVGKLTALGLAGLLQTVGMGIFGYVLFRLGGLPLRLPAGASFSIPTLLWGGVYLLLGYGVSAALMGAAGAMMPDWRESRLATFILVLPAFVGFEITLFQENAHSLLMTVASLFPFTSPLVMLKRLMAGGVPPWQLWVGAALLLLTTWLIMRAAARIFRAQYLLSGESFSYKRYVHALLYG